MFIIRRMAYTGVAMLAGVSLLPTPSNLYAREQLACTSSVSNLPCGAVILVGDSDYPCRTRDGQAFCPVYMVYYPGGFPIIIA